MAKSHLELVTPTEVNRTVAPVRRPNAQFRTREHLTPGEVEADGPVPPPCSSRGDRAGHHDATRFVYFWALPDIRSKIGYQSR
jgi:hypothetical protein